MFSADIKNDAVMFKPITNTSLSGLDPFSRQADISAFTCVGCTSAHYAPKVYLIRGGIKTSLLNNRIEGSTWIVFEPGVNEIRYSATSMPFRALWLL